LAVSGSCDAGWTALFPNFRGRVFADRERLYRIFALVVPAPPLGGAGAASGLPEYLYGSPAKLVADAARI
jgi:hypothetical protein